MNISGTNKYLAFVILIGGKSKRFGKDKGLFEINGKPIISHQIEQLSKFQHDIFVVANSTSQVQNYIDIIDIKNITGFIVDEDIIDIRAPMVGIYSAFKELKALGYNFGFTLSCDNPFLKSEVIQLLIDEIDTYNCVIPKWKQNYLEPLFAIYPIEKALKSAKRSIKRKNYKLTSLLDKDWRINYLSIEERIKPLDMNFKSFFNLNKPSDLDYIE
ncbi:MAG: molybdenum cofactor guanylyltransferase [Candidatus Lokiarchaeota archaeon]|nr:molybdenum cofactor guanylyltransferase [Candidatus Lokiarchaeota archaeon]